MYFREIETNADAMKAHNKAEQLKARDRLNEVAARLKQRRKFGKGEK